MKIRFQANADLKKAIVTGLVRQEPTIDFQTAHDAGLKGADDIGVLAFAANEGRLLISHDQSTMPTHFAEFIETRTSAGVFIIPQHISIADAIEDLLLLWWVDMP